MTKYKPKGQLFPDSQLRDSEIQRVTNYVLKPYRKHSYKDDLHQECWVYALEKENGFEGTLEEFAKYLKVSLEGLCKNYINPDRGSNRVNMNPCNVELDAVVFEKDEYSITRADLLEDDVDLEAQIIAADLLEYLTKSISARDLTLLNRLHEGYTPEQIVAWFPELGITSAKHVFRIIKKHKDDSI